MGDPRQPSDRRPQVSSTGGAERGAEVSECVPAAQGLKGGVAGRWQLCFVCCFGCRGRVLVAALAAEAVLWLLLWLQRPWGWLCRRELVQLRKGATTPLPQAFNFSVLGLRQVVCRPPFSPYRRRIFQYYLPVFFWCQRQLQQHRAAGENGGGSQRGPLILGISAPQGCGKTTLCEQLQVWAGPWLCSHGLFVGWSVCHDAPLRPTLNGVLGGHALKSDAGKGDRSPGVEDAWAPSRAKKERTLSQGITKHYNMHTGTMIF